MHTLSRANVYAINKPSSLLSYINLCVSFSTVRRCASLFASKVFLLHFVPRYSTSFFRLALVLHKHGCCIYVMSCSYV
uniref:Uncharacterized protein n=1 Tax=Arundo donax TaxID=35708 RepID=A0A0A9AIR6_ARUDO